MKDCLHPITAWICGTCVCKTDGVQSPKMVFSPSEAARWFGTHDPYGMEEHRIDVPCGRCKACQIRKRKEMALRLGHECVMHEKACFITLTYNDESIPFVSRCKHTEDDTFIELDRGAQKVTNRNQEYTVVPADLQKFVKRLRRWLSYVPVKQGEITRDHCEKIRYFAVGEYGSKTGRPHYHIMIFGWCPSDLEELKVINGNMVYRSKQIEAKWKFGYSSVSKVSPYVAKYCARYVTKKIQHMNDEIVNRLPEFCLQSIKDGGIGAPWFDAYGCAACLSGQGVCNLKVGNKVERHAIPQYYWSRLRKKFLPTWLYCREQKLDWLSTRQKIEPDFERIVRKCVKDDLDMKHLESFETF